MWYNSGGDVYRLAELKTSTDAVNTSVGTVKTVLDSTKLVHDSISSSIGTLGSNTSIVANLNTATTNSTTLKNTLSALVDGSGEVKNTSAIADSVSTAATNSSQLINIKNGLINALSVSTIISGKSYEIVNLGTTSATQWDTLRGTSISPVFPALGTIFTAAANGSGSIGNGTVIDVANNTFKLEDIKTVLDTIEANTDGLEVSIGDVDVNTDELEDKIDAVGDSLKGLVNSTNTNVFEQVVELKSSYDVELAAIVSAVNSNDTTSDVGTLVTNSGTTNSHLDKILDSLTGDNLIERIKETENS